MSNDTSPLDPLLAGGRRNVHAWFLAGLFLALWVILIVGLIAALISSVAASSWTGAVLIANAVVVTVALWRAIWRRLRAPQIVVPREMRCLLREDRRRQQWLKAHVDRRRMRFITT